MPSLRVFALLGHPAQLPFIIKLTVPVSSSKDKNSISPPSSWTKNINKIPIDLTLVSIISFIN